MSKMYEVEASCSRCSSRFKASLFKSIWGEHEENRAPVFGDQINVLQCPLCGTRTRAPASLMYVDLKRGFVVWYEPTPDPMIDAELPQYAAMFGPESCYVTAPRIVDWEDFKATIGRFERGELRAKPPSMENSRAAVQSLLKSLPKQKQGCLLVIVLAGTLVGTLGFVAARLLLRG
jgi:hypothetical protein